MTEFSHTCAGFCIRCQSVHHLPTGGAKIAALELIRKLDHEKRLDFHLPIKEAHPKFSTDYLLGKARGKMFGIMTCQQADGAVLKLKAFSGQYNGEWEIEGWAPPLFDLKLWHSVNHEAEKKIKKIGPQINALEKSNPQRDKLTKKRRNLSRQLMEKLHQLYKLHNFHSERRPLLDVYTGNNGIPNGTADCCGPKLLNWAARNNLKPLGMAEFYYGRENRQGNRIHATFYPSCREKCAPILGYMLCGLDPDATSATRSKSDLKPSPFSTRHHTIGSGSSGPDPY